MDSGNSGSLQSSSAGGDEEYDSRADSFSAFMNNQAAHVDPIPHPLHTQQSQSQPQPSIFDPLLSNYLHLQNPSSLLINPNMAWTRRSEPKSDAIMGSFAGNQSTVSFSSAGLDHTPNSAPVPVSAAAETGNLGLNQNLNVGGAGTGARNPKKRSRASRRAPTTVLTTDTTNFRAMVQEFTGIPAPPFTSSSFPRSRLDLFTGPRSTTHLDSAQTTYLLRPFAQKVQSSTSTLLSSNAIGSSSSINNHIMMTSSLNTSSVANSSPSINYQVPSQSSNLFDISNPMLTSLFQTSRNSPMLGSKPDQGSLEVPSTENSRIKMRALEEFGFGHVNVNNNDLSRLISSNQTVNRNDGNARNFGADRSNPLNIGDQDQSRAGNGDLARTEEQRKMDYPANFHAGKGPENAAVTRGEGMVEPWICSSD